MFSASTCTSFIPDTIQETNQVILFDEALNNSGNTKPIVPNIEDEIDNNKGTV